MNQPTIDSSQRNTDQLIATTLVKQLHTMLTVIDVLQTQVMQMKDMFDDEDGMIHAALNNANNATASAHEVLTQYQRTDPAERRP